MSTFPINVLFWFFVIQCLWGKIVKLIGPGSYEYPKFLGVKMGGFQVLMWGAWKVTKNTLFSFYFSFLYLLLMANFLVFNISPSGPILGFASNIHCNQEWLCPHHIPPVVLLFASQIKIQLLNILILAASLGWQHFFPFFTMLDQIIW